MYRNRGIVGAEVDKIVRHVDPYLGESPRAVLPEVPGGILWAVSYRNGRTRFVAPKGPVHLTQPHYRARRALYMTLVQTPIFAERVVDAVLHVTDYDRVWPESMRSALEEYDEWRILRWGEGSVVKERVWRFMDSGRNLQLVLNWEAP